MGLIKLRTEPQVQGIKSAPQVGWLSSGHLSCLTWNSDLLLHLLLLLLLRFGICRYLTWNGRSIGLVPWQLETRK